MLGVPKEVFQMMRQHLSEGSKEKAAIKFKKVRLMRSLSEEDFYDVTEEDSDNEIEEVGSLEGVERRQLKQAMKESREMAWRSAGVDIGGSSSQPLGSGINRELHRSMTTREAEISARGIDPYMYPIKQKSIKSMFSTEKLKRLKNSWRNSFTTMQYHSMQLIVILTTKP